MMATEARLAPPYSMVTIADPSSRNVVVPDVEGNRRIASSGSCIVIVCLAEVDGETHFILGKTREVDPGWSPAFQGPLATPGLKVALETAELRSILEASVAQRSTVVHIWTNDPSQPDLVIVGLE